VPAGIVGVGHGSQDRDGGEADPRQHDPPPRTAPPSGVLTSPRRGGARDSGRTCRPADGAVPPRSGVVQRPDDRQRPDGVLGLSVSQQLSVRLGGFRLALDGSGTGGGGRWLTGRRRLRVGEAGGPGGHVVIGELGQIVVAELGQIVIAAFGECEPAAVSPARRDGRVTGVGPGRRRIRQAFLGLPGPRRRRRRLVPGRKLRLRIPGTGIAGQRRVTTGRIAPGPAGRAPRCGRTVTRVGGAMPVTSLGRPPVTGMRGVSLAWSWHRHGAHRRDIPWAGDPVLPRPGQARPYPGGLRIANRQQVPGRGEIDGLVIERGAGRRVGILLGRVGPPPVRRCGDLVARETHVGSVSLHAALNALSGVFPGGTVALEGAGGSPGGLEVTVRLAASGTPPGRRRGCARSVTRAAGQVGRRGDRFDHSDTRPVSSVRRSFASGCCLGSRSGARHRVAADRGLVALPHPGAGKVSRSVANVKVHDCAHI